MTTENQGSPPVNPTPASSLPQQEEREQILEEKEPPSDSVNSATQIAGRYDFVDFAVSLVNGKSAPWLNFVGEPGTKYYAERVAQWLNQTFWGETYEVIESAGWWYAERTHSVPDPSFALNANRASSKDSSVAATLSEPKPEAKELWHVCEHDAGCVMGENNNVIGLAQNADNAENFVKEHNG